MIHLNNSNYVCMYVCMKIKGLNTSYQPRNANTRYYTIVNHMRSITEITLPEIKGNNLKKQNLRKRKNQLKLTHFVTGFQSPIRLQKTFKTGSYPFRHV